MNMRTLDVFVEEAGGNLSAYLECAPICTVGNNMKEIEANIREAIEIYIEDNPNPCRELVGEFKLAFLMEKPDSKHTFPKRRILSVHQ